MPAPQNNGGLSATSLSRSTLVGLRRHGPGHRRHGQPSRADLSQRPSQSGQAADLVLGQSSLSTGTANAGGAAAGLKARPAQVCMSGGRLYVADTANHRVLIWNSLPTQNGKAADVVFGPGRLHGHAGQPRPGAGPGGSLRSPAGVYSDGTSLWVSDTGNSRVLIWNTATPTNGQAADLVVSQVSLTRNTTPVGLPATVVAMPQGLSVLSGQLYIADATFHRVLRFASLPTRNAAVASEALGQPTLTASGANNGGISVQRLNIPVEEADPDHRVRHHIADSGNSRIVALPRRKSTIRVD